MQEVYIKGYLFPRQSLFGQAEIMIVNKYMQGVKQTSSQTALVVMQTHE